MPNLVNDFEVRKETLRALGGDPTGLANIYEVDKEILKLISEGGGGIDWDTIKQKLAEDGVESIKFNIQVPINSKKYIGFDEGALAFHTGHTITTNTRVQMKFRCLKGTDNAFIGMEIIGQFDNTSKWRFVSLGSGTNAFQQICDGNVEHRCTLLNINPDNWYELEIGNCYIKDVQTGEILAQNTDTESGPWGELVLNACRGEKGDIAYVKVFEGDELVIDYIAAADEDGNIGFYESLSNTFTIANGWQRSENGDWTSTYLVQGEVILDGDEVKTLLNQTVLPDAPSDGQQYGRQNGEWTPVQIPTVEKYMTMTIDKSNSGETIIAPTVTGNLPNLNLQYRINNGEWSDFIVGTTADIKVGAGDAVQFKGVNESSLSMDYDNYFNFDVSGLCHLSGNVMSLIDGVGETLEIPNNLCFYRLFYNSKIKTVSSDFLPATTLKEECYRSLFAYCDNLTTAPELPATTLANMCYAEMFSGCSALKQAPELPATTLVDSCYQYMFNYCSSLNYVKCLAEDGILNDDGTSSSSLLYWLSGVSSTGTFVKHDGVSYVTGDSGIPTGWTVKEVDVIEVPNDGKQYSRKNGVWVEAEPNKVKTMNDATLQFWSGTQAEYDAIATKDANTLYVIK